MNKVYVLRKNNLFLKYDWSWTKNFSDAVLYDSRDSIRYAKRRLKEYNDDGAIYKVNLNFEKVK
jgi:hypothetical protein